MIKVHTLNKRKKRKLKNYKRDLKLKSKKYYKNLSLEINMPFWGDEDLT